MNDLSNLFTNKYFIACGMARMISSDTDKERVMDYIKENLTVSQMAEFAYEPEAISLWTYITEYYGEKGLFTEYC